MRKGAGPRSAAGTPGEGLSGGVLLSGRVVASSRIVASSRPVLFQLLLAEIHIGENQASACFQDTMSLREHRVPCTGGGENALHEHPVHPAFRERQSLGISDQEREIGEVRQALRDQRRGIVDAQGEQMVAACQQVDRGSHPAADIEHPIAGFEGAPVERPLRKGESARPQGHPGHHQHGRRFVGARGAGGLRAARVAVRAAGMVVERRVHFSSKACSTSSTRPWAGCPEVSADLQVRQGDTSMGEARSRQMTSGAWSPLDSDQRSLGPAHDIGLGLACTGITAANAVGRAVRQL